MESTLSNRTKSQATPLPRPEAELSSQEARTEAYLRQAAEVARLWYDDSGRWTRPGVPVEARERYWIAPAFLRNGAGALGNAVARMAEVEQYSSGRFNIFTTNIAISLLAQESDHLEPDVYSELSAIAREGLGFKPGNRQPDFQFQGFNDNMPAKATMGLILGGELLGLPDAVEYGIWNLKQLRAMLTRRGINSEFNSPTYSPLSIRAISEIAEFTCNEEARELALNIEARLWIDLAARFHPELGVLCGPGSRCYTADNVAQLTCAAMLFWFVLGDRATPSPMRLFDPECDLVLHHCGSLTFNVAQASYLATGHYHIPDAAWQLLERKPYPFRARATFESGHRSPTFPALPGSIDTYMEPDFGIGCASSPYSEGMVNSGSLCYQVTYRRTPEVRSYREIGTVFHKMLCGEEPGMLAEVPPYRGEADYLPTWGRSLTIPVGRTALVLTQPHMALAEREICKLSDAVIFSAHWGGADEVLVGGEARPGWCGDAQPGEWIVCRRGRLLIGLRPLAYSRHLGQPVIRLRRNENYEWLDIGLYEGAARKPTREELSLCFGGFVAEHASVDDYPSLQAFAEFLAQARFGDYFWITRRVRYLRSGLDLEVSWDPCALLPRYATINGRLLESPMVEIDGVSSGEIPFTDPPDEPVPLFFPWRDFTLGWEAPGKPWNSPPWAIGDRG